jgi:butyrate kinase
MKATIQGKAVDVSTLAQSQGSSDITRRNSVSFEGIVDMCFDGFFVR